MKESPFRSYFSVFAQLYLSERFRVAGESVSCLSHISVSVADWPPTWKTVPSGPHSAT